MTNGKIGESEGSGRLLLNLVACSLLVGACTSSPNSSPLTQATDPQDATCQELTARAREAVESVRLEHLECRGSSDCQLFDPSTDCSGECPKPVASTALDAVRTAIQEVNSATCREHRASGCPVATPGCAPVRVVCRENVCSAE